MGFVLMFFNVALLVGGLSCQPVPLFFYGFRNIPSASSFFGWYCDVPPFPDVFFPESRLVAAYSLTSIFFFVAGFCRLCQRFLGISNSFRPDRIPLSSPRNSICYVLPTRTLRRFIPGFFSQPTWTPRIEGRIRSFQ